jgi:hypothetical protein
MYDLCVEEHLYLQRIAIFYANISTYYISSLNIVFTVIQLDC